MENRVLSFCIILYIVIFYRIVLESLGILVSNGLFLAFYIFVYLSGLASLFHCRSPPISTNFLEIRVDWRFFIWTKIQKEESIKIIRIH